MSDHNFDFNQVTVSGTIKKLSPPTVTNGFKKRGFLLDIAGAGGKEKAGGMYVNLFGDKLVDGVSNDLREGALVLVGGKIQVFNRKDGDKWVNSVSIKGETITPLGVTPASVNSQQSYEAPPLQSPPVAAPVGGGYDSFNDQIPFAPDIPI